MVSKINKIKIHEKSVCVCVCLWLILTLSLPGSAFARENLSVDFDKVIQENFLGINAVYHGFTYMPESIEMGMNDALRAIEMKRVEESGIRIARTFYRPDWAMGEGVWMEPDWNSVKMLGLYKWLADMKERDVDVALNMGWWFARDVIWNRDQHLPTYPDDMVHYARWVSDSLHQIIELRGFDNVKYIFMFTEPGNKFGDIPHGKKTWQYYKDVLRATHDQLAADGRRKLVKMVGPNTTLAPRWVKESVRQLNDVIDIYASHNYNFETYEEWYDLAVKVREATEATGKPFWIDEYGVQDFALRKSGRYGTVLALANAAFINAGAQTSLLWIMNDQYYPFPLKYITNGDAFLDGKHSWGLYPWLPDSQTVRPGWYAFLLMSRLLGGENAKAFYAQGTADLHIAAIGSGGGDVSLLVVNADKQEKEFNIALNREVLAAIHRYRYMPQAGEAGKGSGASFQDKEFASPLRFIEDSIPPESVVFYSTITLDGPGKKGESFLPMKKNGSTGNLAFQKKAFASSSDQYWPATNVTDGKRLRHWSSRPKKENGPESITVDLGRVMMVNQAVIYPKVEGSVSAFPKDFTLAVSVDNETWVEVAKKAATISAGTSQAFHFPAHKARYLRLTGETLTKVENGYKMSVSEFKVYGP